MVGAPAKTPAAIVERLSRESVAALAHPDIQKRAQEMGIRVAGSTPQEARDLLVGEIGRWRKIIQAAGIEPQ
jgi:tripartite-type tricarboxylate transporter receptor subunit TctC